MSTTPESTTLISSYFYKAFIRLILPLIASLLRFEQPDLESYEILSNIDPTSTKEMLDKVFSFFSSSMSFLPHADLQFTGGSIVKFLHEMVECYS